jgi:hypothetical protein
MNVVYVIFKTKKYEKIIVYSPKLTTFFNSNTKISIFAIHPPKVPNFLKFDKLYQKLSILPLIFYNNFFKKIGIAITTPLIIWLFLYPQICFFIYKK